MILAAALLALVTARAEAAPPPPAIVPESLRQPIDGYDLQTLYQLWHYWVEGQKGTAIEALLAKAEEVDGNIPFGDPLLRFAKHNDYGHFLTGEIRAYCRRAEPYGYVPGSCHYRLRRAFVPHDAAAFGGDNPVARWTRESFDGVKLARHLREAGFAPNTDWWRADISKLFQAMPSPVEVLTGNATVVRLDSRNCPELAQAIEAMEAKPLDWRLDFLAVGEDAKLTPPPPHAVRVTYTLRIIMPGPAGGATITGSGPAFLERVEPVLAAADACEKVSKQS